MKMEFVVVNDGVRLTEELKTHVSRKLYKHIKGYNCPIYLNGELTKSYVLVKKGDIITIDYNKEKEINWDIYESKLDIRYEDDNYLVIFKRGGLLSIPTKGNPKSLYQEILYYLKGNNNELNVSILNRLDKDTEGLVLVAKNTYAASLLQPTHMHINRKYLAMCHGIFDKKEDRIILNIKKNGDEYKRIIASDGKESITNYRVLKEIDSNSLVEFELETGRTHQIRITSNYLNHPILGDVIYGNDDIDKLHLTSNYLSFINPFDNKKIEIIDNNPTWLEKDNLQTA